MNKILKTVLIILGVIIGLIILLLSIAKLANDRSEKLADTLDVTISRVDKEDSLADISYTITNNSDKSQDFNSIDIDLDAFEQAEFISVNEKVTDEYNAFGKRTFEFRKKLQPAESITVIFSFKRKSDEPKLLDTDICVDMGGNCIGRSFSL